MRNQIRGRTLILIMSVLLLTGCAAAKINRTAQSHQQEQRGSQKAESEVSGLLSTQTGQRMLEESEESKRILLVEDAVPESQAKVDVPIQSLLDLPDGAEYSAKDGQASIRLQKQGDKIVVTGKCDSIARRCLYYEQEVFRQRSELDSLRLVLSQYSAASVKNNESYSSQADTLQSVQEKPPATWYKWLLAGFISGVALAVISFKTNLIGKIVSFIKKLILWQ